MAAGYAMVCWLFAAAAHAAGAPAPDDVLQRIVRRLDNSPVISGVFVQIKTLQALTRPLSSSGEFVIARSRGLYWRQSAPFLSEILVTDAGFAQRHRGGEVRRYSSADHPMALSFSRIFLSVWRGDFASLQDSFELAAVAGESDWTLTLTPRDALVRKAVADIVVSGDAQLRGITIRGAHGDLTTIDVTAVSTADTLTESQLGYFVWP
jgi:hypothetical protein